jgi:fibronectin-binding autotransporter adhesin
VASGVVVESGGTLSMGGGTVSNLTLESAGVDVVNFGTTFGTTVLSGATEYVVEGAVSGTNISSGGVESLEGGYSFNTTVSGGAVEVLSGVTGASSASDTTVLSGGELLVGGGAIALDAAVVGTEILQGDDYDSTIESGGLHVVQGRSEFTVLSSGANEIVSSGGMAIDTAVDSSAVEIVSSGGATTSTTISSGGIAVVSSGGSAGATVLDGGYELVASGGIMSGAFISAGTLELASGANANTPSEVAFAGSGTLLVDGGTSFAWHISGFSAGDQIDFEDIAFVPPTSKKSQAEVSYTEGINPMVSGTLTVTDGVNTASIIAAGCIHCWQFHRGKRRPWRHAHHRNRHQFGDARAIAS